MAYKSCDVCGKSSGFYPLCTDCFKLKDDGKVLKCEDCGKWYVKEKNCSCKKQAKETSNGVAEEQIKKCILCSNDTNGYFFCKDCYFKFKNKTILVEVKNCQDFTLLDSAYEGKYTCADGHIVKSKSEMAIDDYLYNNNIRHAYEYAFPIDDNPEHDLHPDFYLPDYKGEEIYIEHWGYDESNKDYTTTKEYKLKLYKTAKITLITTDEKKDMMNINAALNRKLKTYKKNEINE